MWLIFTCFIIIISLILLRLKKKELSLLSVTVSLIFALSSPGWYIILDLKHDVFLAIVFGIITLICVLVFSTKEDKTKSRGFIILFAFVLWFSLFGGATRANELYDKSDEQLLQVKVTDITDFGAGRGDTLYYLGFTKTELSCTVSEKEVIFTVPTDSCKDLSSGESIVVGVKDGAIGLKHCYIIFNEDYQVAKEVPKKRVPGRFFIKIWDGSW